MTNKIVNPYLHRVIWEANLIDSYYWFFFSKPCVYYDGVRLVFSHYSFRISMKCANGPVEIRARSKYRTISGAQQNDALKFSPSHLPAQTHIFSVHFEKQNISAVIFQAQIYIKRNIYKTKRNEYQTYLNMPLSFTYVCFDVRTWTDIFPFDKYISFDI